MALSNVESGIYGLGLARKVTLGLIAGIAEDKLCTQLCAGGNHPKWILGHIAWTDNYFLKRVGNLPSRMPNGWNERFEMGSTPSSNSSDYPSLSELQDALSAGREALISWLSALDEQQGVAELPGDLKDFAPSVGVLPTVLAWHEGMHSGQISAVRRFLGLKPMMG